MGSMEDKEYFHSLSRKELQDLCRKNGLPTNKWKSNLVDMLVSYYQNKNASSATLEERPSIPMDGLPLTVPVLNVEPELNRTGEMNEGAHNGRAEADDVDGRRSPTCSNVAISTLNALPKVPSMNSTEVYGFSGFNMEDMAACSLLGSLLGHKYDNNALMSRNTDKLGSLQRSSLLGSPPGDIYDDSTSKVSDKDKPDSDEPIDNNHSMHSPDRWTGLVSKPHIESRKRRDIPVDNSIISLNTAERKLPPNFEFYAASEDGINLTVDLDWNPSDWIKSLNDGVRVHPRRLNENSVELHKELSTSGQDGTETEALLLDNTVIDSNNKGGLTFTNSLLDSAVKEGNHVIANKPDSSSSTGIKPTNAPVEPLSLTKETTQQNSSLRELDFEVQNPTDMCNKSPSQTSEIHNQNLAVPLTSPIKSTGNHVIGSKSAGTKSIDSVEYPLKSCNIFPEKIDTDAIRTSCIPDVRIPLSSEVPETMKLFNAVQRNGSGPFDGFPADGDSVENQLLNVEGLCENMVNSQHQNDESRDLNNSDHHLPKETGSYATPELDLNKSLDLLSEGPEEQPQQRSNPTIEVESSECSHADIKVNSYKRSCSSESEGLKNNSKRQRRNSGDINHLPRRTSIRRVRPRRSMRLVDK